MSDITGMSVGGMLKNQDAELDIDLVIRGIKDGFHGVKPNMSQEEHPEDGASLRGQGN